MASRKLDVPPSSDAPPSLPPRSTARPRVPGGDPVRLLIGAPESAWPGLRRVLQAVGGELVECRHTRELEAQAATGRVDAVVCFAQLEGESTLQLLARLRREGARLPFVVITSQHGPLFRVMVSDSSGTVLSSRVVDPENLVTLVAGLAESHRTGGVPSSRR